MAFAQGKAFSFGLHKYGYQTAAAIFEVVLGGKSLAQIVTLYPALRSNIPVENPETPAPKTKTSFEFIIVIVPDTFRDTVETRCYNGLKMSKENPNPLAVVGGVDIKQQVIKKVAQAAGEYLDTNNDGIVSVSEAQVGAYSKTVEALPDGKVKDLARKLAPAQKVLAKVNEGILNIQDTGWRLVKPIILFRAPLVAAVPDKPLSKAAIKVAKLGGDLNEKIITSVSTKLQRAK